MTTPRALKIQLQSLKVRGSNPDVNGAFREAVKEHVNAIITITNNPLFRNAKKITELAIKNRLPSMYEGSAWVEHGGLMSYSANDLEIFRRAATYVHKILKGPNQQTFRSSSRQSLSLPSILIPPSSLA